MFIIINLIYRLIFNYFITIIQQSIVYFDNCTTGSILNLFPSSNLVENVLICMYLINELVVFFPQNLLKKKEVST